MHQRVWLGKTGLLFALIAALALWSPTAQSKPRTRTTTTTTTTSTYCSVCQHPALAKGVNMFDWFMGPNIYSANHQANYISTDGLLALKRAGFTHLRIPVYAKFIADISQSSAPLYKSRITALDQAIQSATAQGLAVVLVLNAEDDSWRLATSSAAQSIYGNLWRQLAGRYRRYSPKQIYFELLNEPHFQVYMSNTDAQKSWLNLQRTLLSAIRQSTGTHYVIVPSYDWNTVPSFIAANPSVNDSRAIYTAHFYEFIAFSYQGVPDFDDPLVRQLHGLPYPVVKTECLADLAALPSSVASQIQWYCSTGYGPASIDQQLKQFADWAKQRQVPVYLGEFGAYRKYAPPGDAEQWVHDVRTSAQRYSIPWAYWSYKGAMALAPEGQPDPALLKALMGS